MKPFWEHIHQVPFGPMMECIHTSLKTKRPIGHTGSNPVGATKVIEKEQENVRGL